MGLALVKPIFAFNEKIVLHSPASEREVDMFKFVHALTRGPPVSRKRLREQVIERYTSFGRAVAQRFVRGNVNIKAGRFMTDRDLAKRKKDIESRGDDKE
jgi:hypothetical protein